MAFLLAFASMALLTVAVVGAVQSDDVRAVLEASPMWQPEGGPVEAPPAVGAAGEGNLDPGARRAVTAMSALLVLGGTAAWMVVRRAGKGDGDGSGENRPPAGDVAATPLADAVEASLADLDAAADPREAILRCYAHLEAALARAGCPRWRAETPREHRERVEQALGPAAGAAARLVERFETARYGVGPVGEEERREAVAAVHEVRAALLPDGEPVR